MAEILSTALASSVRPNLSAYQMSVRILDAKGAGSDYLVPIPEAGEFAKWTFHQQIAMLKSGTWSKYPVEMIMFAIAYAHSKGLDINDGDVYAVGEGRLAISNKAKIKLALKTGHIKSFKATFRELADEPAPEECVLDYDIECTVAIETDNLGTITKTQKLTEWFNAKNPNWCNRPYHMLEMNTFAHACDYINPTDSSDEFSPTEAPIPISATIQSTSDLVPRLEASIKAVQERKAEEAEVHV